MKMEGKRGEVKRSMVALMLRKDLGEARVIYTHCKPGHL